MSRKLTRRSLSAAAALAGLTLATGSALAQSKSPAVFVANNVSDQITSFRMNPDGTLTFVGNVATGDGPQAISISPDGAFVAVAHGTQSVTTEEVRIFRVNPDASLTQVALHLVPDSPLDLEWVTDRHLAVSETRSGASKVRIFEFDRNMLWLVERSVQPAGSFHSSLAVHPNRRWVYANDTSNSRITIFEVQSNGSLTLLTDFGTPGFAVELCISPDGRFLYGAGGIAGSGRNVHALRIRADGSLEPIPGTPFQSPGASPSNVHVMPDGRHLFVGHGTDATCWSFAINQQTGEIASTGHMFDVGLQGTLGDIQALRQFMFVTDDSTAIDGITGIYSFRVALDGSFTQVAPIYNTGGTRPRPIATWDPTPRVHVPPANRLPFRILPR